MYVCVLVCVPIPDKEQEIGFLVMDALCLLLNNNNNNASKLHIMLLLYSDNEYINENAI